MTLDRLSIKIKLALAFAAMTLVVVGIGAVSVRSLGSQRDAFSAYVNEKAARMAMANDVLDATNARAIHARNLVLVTAQDDTDMEKALVNEAHKKVGESMAKLKRALETTPGVSDEEKALFAKLEAVESKYGPLALRIVGLALEDKRSEAINEMNFKCRPTLVALTTAGNDYIAHIQQLANDEIQSADAAASTSRNTMLAASAVAVALAVVLAFSITRSILSPIHQAVDVAQKVAAGDLRCTVDTAGSEETAKLLSALGSMNESLANIVGRVRQSSDSIATGSAQIAAGSADLSARTEQQAASLEQTAASMEQMNSTVKANSETARRAVELAGSASEAAQRGGTVVGQVVATMDEITASSKKISEIIGVIDGIAFQTNILALNAAVEAARAGEQGRGFAVVASEVRGLAQRSAGAAREIKDLIGASVDKVGTGTRLVADAQASMDDIVAQVQRVSTLISEIGLATVEQTAGIDQVSTAVGQLDEATQQNAALVEQSTAAAASLKQQAASLAEMVGVFKLAA